MPELRACFESAGFSNVRTLLSSGNVVFDARAQANSSIERVAQSALSQDLGRESPVIVHRHDENLGHGGQMRWRVSSAAAVLSACA